MSLAGVSATAVDDAAMASKSASLRRVQWDKVTSGPSRPSPTQFRNLATRRLGRAGMGMDPLSRFACLGPSGRELVEFGLDEVGRGERERGVSGRRCARRVRAVTGTKTVRTPESAWAVSAASR